MGVITTVVLCVLLSSPLIAGQDCGRCKKFTGALQTRLNSQKSLAFQKRILSTKLCPGVVAPKPCYKFVKNFWDKVGTTTHSFFLDPETTCAGAKGALCKGEISCNAFVKEVAKKETHADKWQKIIGHLKNSEACVEEPACYENLEEIIPQALRMLAQVMGEGSPKICQDLFTGDDEVCEDLLVGRHKHLCPRAAANNWCNQRAYKGKCCASCKKAKEERDPSCFDSGQGCVLYKRDMCRRFKSKCKKTCGVCSPGGL